MRRILALGGNPPLAVVLPDGNEVRASTEPPLAWLHVRDRAALVRVFLNPFFQFGEAYSDGGLHVEGDLVEVLEAIEHSSRGAASGGLLARLLNWLARRPRRHTLAASRDNIHHHYDIGNDFYQLWLDDNWPTRAPISRRPTPASKRRSSPSSTTCAASCGCVPATKSSKPAAAGADWRCTWRGTTASRVRAYNISHEQVDFARQRAEREGLADRVEFVEDDWRKIDGRYDAFVSVGMLEHVGPTNYRKLGEVIDRCLREDGRGLIHTIGRNRPQPVDPWIERRIFPGSYPPTLAQMMQNLRAAAVFRCSTSRICACTTPRRCGIGWRASSARSTGSPPCSTNDSCACGGCTWPARSRRFEAGSMQLFQVVFARGTSNDIPRTRAHVYAEAE